MIWVLRPRAEDNNVRVIQAAFNTPLFFVTMKELLKQFLPPLILDRLKKLRGNATGCIELSGWPDSGDNYNNNDIAQLVAAKTAYRISHTPEELTLSELQSIAAVAAAATDQA